MTQQDVDNTITNQKRRTFWGWVSIIVGLSIGGMFLSVWFLAFYASVFLLCVEGLPMLLYMAVMVLWGYPIVYISCLIGAIVQQIRSQSKIGTLRFYEKGSFYASLPIFYVGGLVVLAFYALGALGW